MANVIDSAKNSLGSKLSAASAAATGPVKPLVKPSDVSYGSNVTNFDPNNPDHIKLADAGKQWWDAKLAGDTAGMQAAEQAGSGVRAGLSGSTFNAQSGLSTLGANAQAAPTNDYIQQMRDLAAKNAQAQAYDARNQADATNLQNAKGMQEIMANRGLGSSGENITAMLNQAANRSNSLNSINNQLSTNLNNLDINMAQQLQDQSNFDKNYGLDYANVFGQMPGQGNALRTLAAINADRGYGLDLSRLSGNLPGGGKTLDSKAQDYSQMADARDYNRGVFESNRDHDYKIGRDDVADAQWAKEFAESVKQNGIQNALSQVSSSSGSAGGALTLAQKLSIWKLAGQAPEGIPGVTPGTKVYDEVAARKAAEETGGSSFWDKIKGVVGSITSMANNAVSDDDITNYLK